MLLPVLAVMPAMASGTNDAWTIRMHPSFSAGSPPTWAAGMTNTPSLEQGADALLLPLPPLASQDEIGCYAVTVVFDDNGDGGPVVEWTPQDGASILLSAGLGEQGVPLGPNARTVLLSESLALDGGTLRVSFAGRMNRLRSVSLRPARELSVAALGSVKPALITPQGKVLSEQEVSASSPIPRSGDRTEGRVVSAELSTLPLRLDAKASGDATEFGIPVAGIPSAGVLTAEIGALDPESWIEVSLNGESRGVLATAPIALGDPSTLISEQGRIVVAGWQQASLYLPGRLWKEGDNSLILTLHRSTGDAGQPLYLRNVRCDLLFPDKKILPADSTGNPSTNAPSATASPASIPPQGEPLSNGSLYGNPSPMLFRAALPSH
jgi:hypothetical protein